MARTGHRHGPMGQNGGWEARRPAGRTLEPWRPRHGEAPSGRAEPRGAVPGLLFAGVPQPDRFGCKPVPGRKPTAGRMPTPPARFPEHWTPRARRDASSEARRRADPLRGHPGRAGHFPSSTACGAQSGLAPECGESDFLIGLEYKRRRAPPETRSSIGFYMNSRARNKEAFSHWAIV